ncbi:hypothetical protein MPLB_1200087 [Mesorhizobium sp. ORS 3324]|nr:hypothetical protein MPLB_1200087 [Mesorhizobium sp. ORS 3324]
MHSACWNWPAAFSSNSSDAVYACLFYACPFVCVRHARVAGIFALNPGFGNGPVAAPHMAFAMIESTMEGALAGLFCPLYGVEITHCRSTSTASATR